MDVMSKVAEFYEVEFHIRLLKSRSFVHQFFVNHNTNRRAFKLRKRDVTSHML